MRFNTREYGLPGVRIPDLIPDLINDHDGVSEKVSWPVSRVLYGVSQGSHVVTIHLGASLQIHSCNPPG